MQNTGSQPKNSATGASATDITNTRWLIGGTIKYIGMFKIESEGKIHRYRKQNSSLEFEVSSDEHLNPMYDTTHKRCFTTLQYETT